MYVAGFLAESRDVRAIGGRDSQIVLPYNADPAFLVDDVNGAGGGGGAAVLHDQPQPILLRLGDLLILRDGRELAGARKRDHRGG